MRRTAKPMLIATYRKRVAATAIELARDDPELVKLVIARLRSAGDIDPDDLVYLDRIADRWIAIARDNRLKVLRQRAKPVQGASLRC